MSKKILNLNYFISLFVSVTMFALYFIAPLLCIILGFITHRAFFANSWVNVFLAFFVFVSIVLVWKKKGALLPVALKPNAENRFRLGNVSMGIANSMLALSILVCFIGYHIDDNFGLFIGFIIAGALMFAVMLNVIGIACIETSRA